MDGLFRKQNSQNRAYSSRVMLRTSGSSVPFKFGNSRLIFKHGEDSIVYLFTAEFETYRLQFLFWIHSCFNDQLHDIGSVFLPAFCVTRV